MFLLIGVAVMVDLIFLFTVTAIPTARLRLNKVELPPTVSDQSLCVTFGIMLS